MWRSGNPILNGPASQILYHHKKQEFKFPVLVIDLSPESVEKLINTAWQKQDSMDRTQIIALLSALGIRATKGRK